MTTRQRRREENKAMQQEAESAAASATDATPAPAIVRRSSRKRRQRTDDDDDNTELPVAQTKRVRVSEKEEPENGNGDNGDTKDSEMIELSTSPLPPLPPEMEMAVNGKGAREVTDEQENSTEAAEVGENSKVENDVDMKEQDDETLPTKDSAASQVLMNGSHLPEAASETENKASSAPLPTENLNRLKMPSQHTPGRALHETQKLREPEVETIGLPPTRLDLGDTDDEAPKGPRIEPQKKPAPLLNEGFSPAPDNGNNDDASHEQEEQEQTASDLRTSAQQYASSWLNEPSSPQTQPLVVEEEDVVPSTKSSASLLFRSVGFWVLLLTLLQATFHNFWLNPILHTVVQSSKALTVVYRDALGVKGSSLEQQSPSDVASEEVVVETNDEEQPDIALIEEKLLLRMENERVAEQNRETIEENERRIAENQRRTAERERRIADKRLRSEEKRGKLKAANDQMAGEADALKERLIDLEQSLRSVGGNRKSLKNTLKELLDQWDEQRNSVTPLIPQSTKLADQAAGLIGEVSKQLDEDASKMEEGIQTLQDIVSKNNLTESKEDLAHVRSLLGAEEEKLLDIFQVHLWEPTLSANCSNATSLSQTEKKPRSSRDVPDLPSKEEVQKLLKLFQQQLLEEKDHVMDEGDLRDSLEDLLFDRAELHTFDDLLSVVADNITTAPEVQPEVAAKENNFSSATKPAKKNSLDSIRAKVWERLEIQRADQTGRIDYAAVMNGARVIRSSPSLVDTLPIGNRLAAFLSLRFYGYGPEAALTPTWPPNALGQCWAFEMDANPVVPVDRSEMREKTEEELAPKRMGAMADLTIQLAKPIYVESVSIEHPPPELTDKPNTVVQQFKVFGYVREDGWGYSWHLGTFSYNARDPSSASRQEFEIPSTVLGQDVPKLSSITLAIDSNWGTQVSCLYRFRVHGAEEKESLAGPAKSSVEESTESRAKNTEKNYHYDEEEEEDYDHDGDEEEYYDPYDDDDEGEDYDDEYDVEEYERGDYRDEYDDDDDDEEEYDGY